MQFRQGGEGGGGGEDFATPGTFFVSQSSPKV